MDDRAPDDELLRDARIYSTPLRRHLISVLESTDRVRHVVKDSGRRLSARHLHRVGVDTCGTPKVFRHRVEGQALNTAIYILGDRSVSMRTNNRAAMARQACISVAAALDQVPRVARAVAMFDDSVDLLLDFDERLTHTVGRFRRFLPRGTTAMDGALIHAARALLLRDEPRKICLVNTDGDPNSRPRTVAVIEAMEEAGIEVMGIGIQHNAVANLFTRYTVVQDLAELAPAMFRMVKAAVR